MFVAIGILITALLGKLFGACTINILLAMIGVILTGIYTLLTKIERQHDKGN